MLNTADQSLGTTRPSREEQRRRLVQRLAQNVVRARQEVGLTQHQLAQGADLSRATVHLIEAGACDPRLSTIIALATALGLDALQLFDAPPAPPTSSSI